MSIKNTIVMSNNTWEKTTWEWELYLFNQRIQQWLEYQYSQLFKNIPENSRFSISEQILEILQVLFWLILVLLLAWVIWRLWQEFYPEIHTWWKNLNSRFGHPSTPDSPPQLSGNFLLSKSQEFYHQGDYQKACQFLYFSMLQQLHERAIALQEPSRTDGEYLQLLLGNVASIQPYETLITTHEQLCFSNHKVSAENYQHCLHSYQELFNSP